jgi:hypothetical protein
VLTEYEAAKAQIKLTESRLIRIRKKKPIATQDGPSTRKDDSANIDINAWLGTTSKENPGGKENV